MDNQKFRSLVTFEINDDFYNASRVEKIYVLKKLGCLELTSKEKAEWHRLYQSRCVDKIKPCG